MGVTLCDWLPTMAQHVRNCQKTKRNFWYLLVHLRISAQTIKLMICPQWSEAFYAAIPEAVNKPTQIALVHRLQRGLSISLNHRLNCTFETPYDPSRLQT